VLWHFLTFSDALVPQRLVRLRMVTKSECVSAIAGECVFHASFTIRPFLLSSGSKVTVFSLNGRVHFALHGTHLALPPWHDL
jgi:hypothetical protein